MDSYRFFNEAIQKLQNLIYIGNTSQQLEKVEEIDKIKSVDREV